MRLLVQPGDGITPLVKAIDGAKRSVDIMIFRFNRKEIRTALVKAAGRGVKVNALIASTNRGGERVLRELETALLGAGVTVSRTADDLVRYHGKYMIVDRKDLFLMAFNLTFADIERSRSFSIVTTNAKLVREAAKLFDADVQRQPYEASNPSFLVSPLNAREELAGFISGARKQLIIYDPKISDPTMMNLLAERAKAGVEIRVIGRVSRPIPGVQTYKLGIRLHTRSMVRDGKLAFIGSQSLRTLELDARREVGAIVRDAKICKTLGEVFEKDWSAAVSAGTEAKVPATKAAKKLAKAVIKELPPMAPVVEGVVRELNGNGAHSDLSSDELEQTVKDAVKQAVKEAVRDAVRDVVVEQQQNTLAEEAKAR